MADLSSAKDIAAIAKDIATSLALLWASIWAAVRFGWLREHRQSKEAAKITLAPRNLWLDRRVVLYVSVQIESIGSSEIRARRAELTVSWLAGTEEIGPPQRVSTTRNDDPTSIYLIDKGEQATFAFGVQLAFEEVRPTAARLFLEFSSDRILPSGSALSWAREEIYVLQEAPHVPRPSDSHLLRA